MRQSSIDEVGWLHFTSHISHAKLIQLTAAAGEKCTLASEIHREMGE